MPNWLNNNPFRQVDVVFKPGEKLGATDVELDVNDRLPFRPYVGYEDSGTRFTGPDRFITGFGDPWCVTREAPDVQPEDSACVLRMKDLGKQTVAELRPRPPATIPT